MLNNLYNNESCLIIADSMVSVDVVVG